PPIQRFGVAAALSAGATFLITMTFIPAVAALLKAPAPASAVQSRARGLAEFVLRRPRLSLLGALGFCLALGLGWLKVEVYTDFLSFFPEQDPLVESVAAIESRFVGVAPCEVIVATPPGRSRDPRVLELTLALERQLEASEMVDVCFSAADMVAEATRLMTGKRGIPPDAAGIARVEKVLRQVAGHEDGLQQLISPPGGVHPGEEWVRITVRARSVGSHRYGELSRLVREFSREHFEPIGVRALPTGTSIVFSESAQAIVDGQIKSFFFAYVLITVVLSVFLRSLRLGLISAIPNVAPIAALLGVMGYLGIPFNSFNSMVASIALGIAVDDTIHVLAGFQRSARELPLREAVAATIGREGTALISTSAVLFCGFGFLLLATFVPTTEFGLLTAVAIAVALLGDLVILPALLVLCPWLTGVRGVEEAPPAPPADAPALGGPPTSEPA
ncbi:MAG TPA: hypothetical protein DEA08_01825, partial [Planctomycetes bacterium]|nr:hypothetical protein [Planctomycetota bacterium]